MPSLGVTLSYADAEPRIQDAWIALYRGKGWMGRWIEKATGGPYSHAALLYKSHHGIDALEVREFVGGRAVPFEDEVAKYPGQIDVFSPDRGRWPTFKPFSAVAYMRNLTSRPYGYFGVTRLFLCRLPILRLLWPIECDDDANLSIGAPFCSHAVCTACRVGGKVDPCPRKPDYLVTPNDLAQSLFFKQEFTLVP